MSNLVIVAIPDENEPIWKLSSEKIPHLTILFLGETDQISKYNQIVEFVAHASTTLNRFYLTVDRRGELGEDKADVLFFKRDRYDYKAIRDFRSALLQDNTIRSAYDSASQFEGPWNPHLTMGYPATPAKEAPDGYTGSIYSVSFTKIAVWTGDYEGSEFPIQDKWDQYDMMDSIPMDVVMSDLGKSEEVIKPVTDSMAQTADLGADFLAHYGVKGQRWGVRKDNATGVAKKAGQAVDKAYGTVERKAGDFKFERRKNKSQTILNLTKEARKATKEKDLPTINQKYKDLAKTSGSARIHTPSNVPAQKQYHKEIKEAYRKRLEEAANSMTNASGTKRYEISDTRFGPSGSATRWKVKSRQVQHAVDDELLEEFEVEPVFDDDGYIIDIKMVEDLAQSVDLGAQLVSDIFEGETIEHFGIKGMHWGQRKAEPTAVSPTVTSRVPHGAKRKTKLSVEGGENHPAHEDAIKVAESRAKLRKSGTASLSNKELRDVANRLQLEQQVKQLNTRGGKKFVTGLLKSQGQQSAGRVITKQALARGL